jgi:arylformamidase
MQLIDVTAPIRAGMPVYPGDPPVRMELAQAIADGDAYNVTRLDLGLHTGTHVDAPVHAIDGGAGIEALPLDALVGPAEVVDFPGRLPGAPRILLRARGATLGLAEAQALTHALLVGIDGPTIGGEEVHRTLLAAGVVVLEGLDLRAAGPGPYELLCLPLLVEGADGAPARVLLRDSRR